MSINIRINDLAGEPAHALLALGNFFLEMANKEPKGRVGDASAGLLISAVSSGYTPAGALVATVQPEEIAPTDPRDGQFSAPPRDLGSHKHTGPVETGRTGPDTRIKPEDSPSAGLPDAREVFIANAPPVQLPVTPPTVGAPPTLDAAGLPWDGRIHAETKALLANGKWKYKRNTPQNPVTDELIALVEAELRGRIATTPPAPSAPARPPMAGEFLTVPPREPGVVPPAPGMAPPAPAPSAPPPAPPAPPAPPPGMMPWVKIVHAAAAQRASGQLPPDREAIILREVGLNSIPEIAARPDLVETLAAKLGVAL